MSSGVTLDLTNSISNLIGDPNSSAGLVDGNLGNIVGDGVGGVIPIATILDTNLADNGGPTFTHALVSGSRAIDTADAGIAPTVDQRGITRPIDGDLNGSALPDIGAYEAEQVFPSLVVDTTTDIDDGVFTPGNFSLREAVRLANVNPDADTITFDAVVFATPQTITLAGTRLDITESVVVQGPGATLLTISGNNVSQIFGVTGATIDATLSGMTLTGGSTTGDGGAIEVSFANLTVADSTITGNSAGVGGGIYNSRGSTTVTNTTISGNTATTRGGGIRSFVDVDDSLTITDSVVSGNTAVEQGGGIYSSGGTTTISNTTIENNSSGYGGGIFNQDANLEITGSTIQGNTGSTEGGGLYAYQATGGSVTITGTSFNGNVTNDSGGGAFINGPTTTVTNSNFNSNQALGTGGLDGVGGGLYIRGQTSSGAFSVSDTNFDLNQAFGGGGGAFFVNVDGSVDGGNFTSNQVTGNGTTFDTGGGAIAAIGETVITTVDISSVVVDGNSSPSAGGIGIVDSVVTISDSTISDNTATEVLAGGGGIGAFATGSLAFDLLTVTNSTISGNTTAGEGGGIGIIDGNARITDTEIHNNRASGGRGGGIGAVRYLTAGTVTISRSTLSANTASDTGGGIAALNMGIDLENVTISGNDAGSTGGGLAYDNIDDTVSRSIRFSTITSNTSVSGGANIAAAGLPISVFGTIVDNGDVLGAAGALSSLGGNLDSGNTAGFDQPTDLINTDPLLGPLADNTGPVMTHALLPGSPAIDTGPATEPPIRPTTDARGVARPIDGDGNGTLLFDIGAFEAEQSAGVLSISPTTISINEDAGTVTLTVTRSGGSLGAVSVAFETVDGTALAGSDYTTTNGTLNFADGETSMVITVPILDDTISEPSETFTVNLLSPGGGATLGTDATSTVTIVDDDLPGVLSIDPASVSVNETAGTVTLTVNRTGGSDGTVTVAFDTVDGTATAGSDYTATSGTLSFADGETSMTITVPIIDDMIAEPDETFAVTLLSPGGGATLGTPTSATVTIVDVTTMPGVLAIDPATVSVNENAGTVTLTVNRTGGSDGIVSVGFETFDGTALAGSDYTTTSGSVTFANGQTSTTITVPILNDAIPESNEDFTVTLIGPGGGATLGTPTTTTVTIIDDDLPGVLAIDPATVSVNEDDGTVTLTVNRTGGSVGIVSVGFETFDGTALAGSDYTTTNGSLTFADGQTSATITVPILNDAIPESNEDFTVTLIGPGGGATLGTPTTSTVTIIDDDLPGVLSIDPATVSVDEDAGTVTLIVNRTGGSSGIASVGFETFDGTATAGSDYTASSGSVTFADGQTSSTIVIPILDDTVSESDETFTVVLIGASGASLGAPTVSTVTILDNDFNPSVDGHVYCDSNGNGSEDPTEASVGATVFIDLNGDRVLNRDSSGTPLEPTATTDSFGDFVFGSVPLGQATLALEIPDGCHGIPADLASIQANLSVGQLAREIEAADYDGDGDDDLWIVADFSNSLTILENNGGSFSLGPTLTFPDQRPQAIDVWHSPSGIAYVAVTTVGLPEVAVEDPTTPEVDEPPAKGAVFVIEATQSVIERYALGEPIPRFQMGNGPIDVVVDDFNNDGLPDYVAAAFRSSDVYLMLSGETESRKIADSRVAISVTTGDFDGDDQRDIALVGYESDDIQVLFGDGSGQFPRSVEVPSFSSLVAVGAADLDGIFGDELIVLSHGGDVIVLAVNSTGASTLGAVKLGGGTTKFEVGDLNRDGLLDVAVIRPGNATIDLLVGNGQGGLTFMGQADEADTPVDVVFADLDGDQIDELAVADVFHLSSTSGFSLPSLATMLKLNVSLLDVVITANVTQQVDFAPIPFKRLDVNRDRQITARDALQVINAMNRLSAGEGESLTLKLPEETDVNGDGQTSAIDALMIINHLSREPGVEGSGVAASEALAADLVGGEDDDDRDDVLAAIDLILSRRLV